MKKTTKDRPKFMQLNMDLIRHKDTTMQEKILLVEIFNLSKTQVCNADNDHFAERFNIGKTSVSRSLSRLVSKGYINTKIKPKSRNFDRTITINNLLITINKLTLPVNILLFDLLTNCQESKGNIESNNKEDNIKEQIVLIFNYWKLILNHSRSKIDNKRKKKIRTALESFSFDECKHAIDGCKKSPWHMGQNDRNRKYDSIDLIFRDNAKVEEFINCNTTNFNENNNGQFQNNKSNRKPTLFERREAAIRKNLADADAIDQKTMGGNVKQIPF